MKTQDLATPGVRGLTPYLPGKPTSELERELGIDNIIKLASNENPLGPGSRALEAIRNILPEVHLYPDGGGYALKQALSARLGVSAAQITLGNGSNDVLELVARAFLAPGLEAVFSEYAFAVYPIVTQATGARGVAAKAHDGSHGPRYGHDLEAMAAAITDRTRVVFIANPNNPTGTYLDRDTLRAFIGRLPDSVIVVVDEAYLEYVGKPDYPNALSWLPDFPNLVVARTFSKAYGLAGLRVGYAVSGWEVADLLNRVRQPFNVNALGLEAARAALDDQEHLAATVNLNNVELAAMSQGLSARGFEVIPSVGNFVTFDLGQAAAPLYSALLREGVIVRPIANYGLPNHLRVTIGTADQNRAFLTALDRVTGS